MSRVVRQFLVMLTLLLSVAVSASAQTTGSISGIVQDEKEAALPNATVTARNIETNLSRTAQTNDEGRYNFANLPVGAYEITVEASNFTKYVQSGITLSLNQAAVVDVTMKPGALTEVVTVTENAALLNTSTAEVSTRFDTRRVSELPLAPNRNVYNVALSAPGVSQLGSGQTGFASGVSYSSNGGRLRSNNFMIDGQDINDPSISGGQQAINNPDVVQEVRLITNQFLAEYGRNSGSVLNIITKAGTNDYHGTAFWFYNGNALNACSNLNKTAGFCRPEGTTLAAGQSYKRPFRIENQIGFTIGGPLHLPRFGEGGPTHFSGRDRTFFFGSYQRWSDRQLGSGFTLVGAPTEAGRQVLQAAAGNRPQVAALLKFLPAAQTTGGPTRTFTIGGQTFSVPTGNLTGSASNFLDDHQASFRVDHRVNAANNLSVRYLYNDQDTGGGGQVTPAGLTTKNVFRSQAANVSLVSVITPNLVNEVRAAWSRLATTTASDDASSESIPSIEINELGLQGFNAANNRTAIGLAVNLPQFRNNNTYQVQDNLSWSKGNHAMKFGADIHRTQVKSFFVPTIRGLLRYSTLQNFVNDVADLGAQVNRPLPGGQEIQYYYYYDQYYYGQDQWKIRPNFTLTYGLRYELPGNNFDDLVPINNRIVAANGNDERFRFTPVPGADKNNLQPRLGFNYNPRTDGDGVLGWLTGGDKLVIRGGYARTHDSNFININLNIASAFPFVAAINLPATGAFSAIPTAQPAGLNPATFARTIVAEDFRAPVYDQFSLEMQRELTSDLVLRVGYVGTKGRDLFQTIDGNPRQPSNRIFVSDARFSQADNATLFPNVDPATRQLIAAARAPGTPNNPCRVDIIDPTNCTRGVIRLRANGGESDYHSMQVSLDKRLSRGFSAGVHYTWSSFIDTASELFNPSGGEVAVSQNSFDRDADRGRSTYDRPQRLSGNFVYELPFFREQQGLAGHVLGGWQFNGFFTFQSGAPFTPLNGADPTGALNGIDGLVGNAIRANVNQNLDYGNMTVEELFALRGPVTAAGNNLFRALQCTGPLAPDSTAAQPRYLPSATCERFGDAGRNILRADGIGNLDFGIIKNTRLAENVRLQLRADMFNATNTRNFGIPNTTVNSGAFLNQWTTNGGNRRIIVGARLVF
ncbi:MAG TPA: carboxypeptidase-like regulatory domain-containing protein [Pyrinomonadaceae bacterium]|nr:carboxypeptidase-like regulatory domain-containing protein [Pyrinomonadaceae bacterium]